MNLTMENPDDIANRLHVEGGDLSRYALEALERERAGREHLGL